MRAALTITLSDAPGFGLTLTEAVLSQRPRMIRGRRAGTW